MMKMGGSRLTQHETFAVPGDPVAMIEQCISSSGTYEADGLIHAEVTGIAQIDALNKTVKVKPVTRTPVIPRVNDVVIGVVAQTQDKTAFINIARIGKRKFEKPFTGVLHIWASSPRYERNMTEVCKAGDIVRARIESASGRIPELTTLGRELGVLWSSCSKCGGSLFFSNDSLRCQECSNQERRKLAADYGKWAGE